MQQAALLLYLRLGFQVVPDSWFVFALASVSLILFSRKCEYGPSFTYAWLWLGILSWLMGSDDARALFYLTGFGLVVGWYAIQIVQRDIWSRILVYWRDYFPAWCISPLVRLGDVLIHIAPFVVSLPYYDKVQPHHVFQAVCYERVYFYAIEGRPIGDGSIVNKIYALQPPCQPEVFRSLQMLSTVGYFIAATVCATNQMHQQFLQVLWISMFVFVALNNMGLLPDRVPDWDLTTLKGLWENFTPGPYANSILVISPPILGKPPPEPVVEDRSKDVSVKELLDRILKLETLVSTLKVAETAPPPRPSSKKVSPLAAAILGSDRPLQREAVRQLESWQRQPKCVCVSSQRRPPQV